MTLLAGGWAYLFYLCAMQLPKPIIWQGQDIGWGVATYTRAQMAGATVTMVLVAIGRDRGGRSVSPGAEGPDLLWLERYGLLSKIGAHREAYGGSLSRGFSSDWHFAIRRWERRCASSSGVNNPNEDLGIGDRIVRACGPPAAHASVLAGG